MSTPADDITKELHNEIERTPARYRSLLLRLVRSFRAAVEQDEPWSSAAEAFREGWRDVKGGRMRSMGTFWEGIGTD